MKNIILAICLFISSFCINAQVIKDTDLFLVVGKTDEFALIVDVNSITKQKDFRFAKTVIIYLKENLTIIPNKKVKNFVRFTQYDCKTSKMRTGKKIFLDESLNVLGEDDKLEEWYLPKDLSIGKLELDFMCFVDQEDKNQKRLENSQIAKI